jgi:hypothetical protein
LPASACGSPFWQRSVAQTLHDCERKFGLVWRERHGKPRME